MLCPAAYHHHTYHLHSRHTGEIQLACAFLPGIVQLLHHRALKDLRPSRDILLDNQCRRKHRVQHTVRCCNSGMVLLRQHRGRTCLLGRLCILCFQWPSNALANSQSMSVDYHRSHMFQRHSPCNSSTQSELPPTHLGTLDMQWPHWSRGHMLPGRTECKTKLQWRQSFQLRRPDTPTVLR